MLADGLVDAFGGHGWGLLAAVLSAGVLILDDIDTCQYARCHEAPDRPRRPPPPGRRRPDSACDPAPAQRLRGGLCLRLHRLLRRQPADRLASSEGASRRGV